MYQKIVTSVPQRIWMSSHRAPPEEPDVIRFLDRRNMLRIGTNDAPRIEKGIKADTIPQTSEEKWLPLSGLSDGKVVS